MVGSHTDDTRCNAQGVEAEDGENMDDNAGEGDFCQVGSNILRSRIALTTVLA